MLASLESIFHRLRRRFSRSEWAARRFQLPLAPDSGEEPGLLLIQIDGLSRRQMESALASGRMPFLQRLKDRGKYTTHTFYPGFPTTTPAVQAELFYGVRAAVPAFSFLDRSKGETGSMFDPEWVKCCEEKISGASEGLLCEGSSWSNIYCGGASAVESHFCVARLGLSPLWKTNRFGSLLLFLLMELPAILRIVGLVILELAIGLGDVVSGILRGKPIILEFGMLLSRMCVGVGLREVLTVGAKVDLARGLPIVHVNFLGYDELSHRRGPASAFAHWSLRGIDRSIRHLATAAHRSHRRDYQVWIFSDHGQEDARSFALEVPGGIEGIVADCLEVARARDAAFQRPPPRWPLSRRDAARTRTILTGAAFSPDRPFALTAMGPVGNLYFAEHMNDERKAAVAQRLIKHVPGVLRLADDGTVIWYHPGGETRLPSVPPPLLGHPEALRTELIEDMAFLCRSENAGDLILLGWGGENDAWTFPSERGAHAGPGLEETQGFLLVPPATHLPDGAQNFVRPSGLRAAARALLKREDLPSPTTQFTAERLTMISYNVHSCIGMDGRVSPRRVARAIAQQAPDIVALQEIDHGRHRSRAEDQARAIGEHLGFHYVFCPTVVHGDGRYGHALLSRWPIEVVKIGALPSHAGGIWPEERGALWTRILLHEIPVNVLSTHLGLSSAERLKQMTAILGDEWLGPILQSERIILCGDFNLTPGSPAHRMAASRLRDVAHEIKRGVRTFSSIRLVAQLDHIFVSSHFTTESVYAAQNDVTRVASDHLPLVAHLR